MTVYIIDKRNTTIHMAEYYGRSHRYYTKCGIVINKTDRVNTIGLSDMMSWVCPTCVKFRDFFVGEEDITTKWSETPKYQNLVSRLTETIVWYEKGFIFVLPENKYNDEINRESYFMRKMQRYASRKHRKSHDY